MSTLLMRDQRVIVEAQKLRFFPLEVTGGRGCRLITTTGESVLDLSAGWCVAGLGYSHPNLKRAIGAVLESSPPPGVMSVVYDEAVAFAEELLALVPGEGARKVYIGHAGTDANEVTLRACQHATGKPRIVSFGHSYHGGLGLARLASGVHIDAGVAASPDVAFVPYADPYRPHTGEASSSVRDCLDALREVLAVGDVAAVIFEPLLSDGGLVVPAPDFLRSVCDLCRATGTLTICDEVKVGLGRTGMLHAFLHEAATPDIITFGKSLGAGFPISAAVGPAEVLDGPPGTALLTTAGNPFSTAAARVVLQTIVTDRLAENAADLGDYFVSALRARVDALPEQARCRVGEIRGRGLAIGVDLVADIATKERDSLLARKVAYRARELGAVFYIVASNVLEITPPLIISRPEVDEAVDIISNAIADAVNGRVTDAQIAPFLGW
jgi:4-aminobutyrate aminotransferase